MTTQPLLPPPFIPGVRDLLAWCTYDEFDARGLTRGGYVTHLRNWPIEAVLSMHRPRVIEGVSLEVTTYYWPARRGVTVSVLGFMGKPAAILGLVGRSGDDRAYMLIVNKKRLKRAAKALNAGLPKRWRRGSKCPATIDILGSSTRVLDTKDELTYAFHTAYPDEELKAERVLKAAPRPPLAGSGECGECGLSKSHAYYVCSCL